MKKPVPSGLLSDAQFHDEVARCEFCEEKPCKEACPADCSPADFMMACRAGTAADFRRAASIIMGSNPLGGICGAVCPDYLCMRGCVRRTFDRPVNIPAVQSHIIRKAYDAGLKPFPARNSNGLKVAVLGAGPAGLAGAAVLAQLGYEVDILEKNSTAGGMVEAIPAFRLDRAALARDLQFILGLGNIRLLTDTWVGKPSTLLGGGEYKAVLVSTGLDIPIKADIKGEELAYSWQEYLENQDRISLKKKKVAVIGGGAIAVDCAVTARRRGAEHVELFYRRRTEHMPLTGYERGLLLAHGVEVTAGTRVLCIRHSGKVVKGIDTIRHYLASGKKPFPANFRSIPAERVVFRECDAVIVAIGSTAGVRRVKKKGLFYAGDMVHGAATVVEAVAAGKNAAAGIDAMLRGSPRPEKERGVKSRVTLAGRVLMPVPLTSEFFGRSIHSPFLLSAAPHTDGYAQMKSAYDAGWAGGVMKTAFDDVPVHIPGGYMFVLGESTYANCDNVSGHALRRVAGEVQRLVREYPDRLTMASTGGPVTGDDAADRVRWQANTKRLEDAGAMGIEYSLSCPQGGDGTQGDLVSQHAGLTAKIIEWVLEAGDPAIPKLFKLTGAVTSIRVIAAAARAVFDRHPRSRAGITLANSFPTLAFRPAPGRAWDEGVIVGMSGEGVLPISNLTLARVADVGITISGNGGAMDYRAAANFLALGASTVQFCTIVMKYGLGIVDELHSGLSFLLQERGLNSVAGLIGSALPVPITPFEQLSATKDVPGLIRGLCEQCGNCTRCPYMAITMDARRFPVIDASMCIGCSLCVQKCFAGALAMRTRTPEERQAMAEG